MKYSASMKYFRKSVNERFLDSHLPSHTLVSHKDAITRDALPHTHSCCLWCLSAQCLYGGGPSTCWNAVFSESEMFTGPSIDLRCLSVLKVCHFLRRFCFQTLFLVPFFGQSNEHDLTFFLSLLLESKSARNDHDVKRSCQNIKRLLWTNTRKHSKHNTTCSNYKYVFVLRYPTQYSI